MDRTVAWIAPLVAELEQFCRLHEAGDPDAAAAGMLDHLRHDWTGVPQVDLPPVDDDDAGPEELALTIVRDVGEVAGILRAGKDLDAELAWARANLIADLGRYAALTEAGGGPPDHDTD